MPARNVSLTPYLADFVDRNVKSGQFQNASEVVREALRLLDKGQQEQAAKLEALRAAVKVGLDAAERGDVTMVRPGELGAFIRSLGRTGSQSQGPAQEPEEP
jgi:antitoxin ParD1/3/4